MSLVVKLSNQLTKSPVDPLVCMLSAKYVLGVFEWPLLLFLRVLTYVCWVQQIGAIIGITGVGDFG
jgi:hypothetical protein